MNNGGPCMEGLQKTGSGIAQMELDLTNIKPQFRSRRLQRSFGFVFDYVDTSALTGQAYLPAMISESTADLYRSSRPAFKREVIRASRVQYSSPVLKFPAS